MWVGFHIFLYGVCMFSLYLLGFFQFPPTVQKHARQAIEDSEVLLGVINSWPLSVPQPFTQGWFMKEGCSRVHELIWSVISWRHRVYLCVYSVLWAELFLWTRLIHTRELIMTDGLKRSISCWQGNNRHSARVHIYQAWLIFRKTQTEPFIMLSGQIRTSFSIIRTGSTV